ncbi:hypothetical protein ATANTOWER_014714 [Ataeniobius toweri]|uniref:Uncharacterized protein n=1 Tax=Ataeniobius toweri TaxID=208326 RepID=A0ABU7BJ20_9TELE|nr:hypothetical protein [Ataeniobius toweri]
MRKQKPAKQSGIHAWLKVSIDQNCRTEQYRTVLKTQTGGCLQGATLETFSSAVLNCINFCTEAMLTIRTIRTFLNQKPRFNSRLRALPWQRDAVFRSNDMLAYAVGQSQPEKMH